MTVSSVMDDSLLNHLLIISPPKKPAQPRNVHEYYASFGSTLGSIWIWPCSKSTYVSGWSTCFSIFRKNLGGSNGWKEFGCLWWCAHSQNRAVNWLTDQSRPLRRKRRKIRSETKTGSSSKLLNDACHATAGMQPGGLGLGFTGF